MWTWGLLPWALIAMFVAAVAGAADILSRYRDEPFRAIFSRYGWAYMAVNALIGLIALTLFGLEHDGTGFKGMLVDDSLPLNAIAVGTGAMLLLRSKLFSIRGENGAETSFGPQIVLDALLVVLDRGIDRQRAAARHTLVYKKLAGITNFSETARFFQMSLLSFQNLSEVEKSQLVDIIDEYDKDTGWSDSLKVMAVGFAILTVAGEQNFATFVDSLQKHLDASTNE